MGNFEINEPTKAQLNALAKLSTALMIRYRINPDSEIYAHIDDDHEPYIKDVVRTSFIGHRDTGKTACPGKNLYNKLPIITQAIRTQLLIQKKSFSVKKVRKIYNHTQTVVLEKDQ
jgi:N-acetyl-anhydromuramyl-L-alanine amidase AmpD